MRRAVLLALLVIVVVAAIAFALGPRVSADTAVTFDPQAIGPDPAAYLAASEAKIPGIRPGLEKEIVWADPETRSKTPLSLVYIHGFSASKGELRPLPDEVAAAFGANIFYTRLAGHGRSGAAMAEASVNKWVNDVAEALAIGRAIGERVLVMGTSTGGSLITWAAARPDMMRDVAGVVLFSPNYGQQARGAWILTMPWGGTIAKALLGPERGFKPINALHAKYWTTRYPTRALLTMAAMAKLAREAPVERIRIPALFVYSPADKVVRPDVTRKIAERWGAPRESILVEESGDPSNHVIAGAALSPRNTDLLAGQIIPWVRNLP